MNVLFSFVFRSRLPTLRRPAVRHVGPTLVALLFATLTGCSALPQAVTPIPVTKANWAFHSVPGVELKTPHYLVRTTCKMPSLLEAIPGFLETCWANYAKLLPTDQPPTEPMLTYLFAARHDWERFTEEFAPPRADVYKKIRSGGYSERGVTVSHYASMSATLSILAHEGFHQYLELTRGKNIPAWLNEGLACYFESFDLDANNRPVFSPERNALRRGHLAEALATKRMIPLSEILGTHAGEQVQKASADVRTYYAQEWSLVLFLLQPTPANPYYEGFKQLLADLGTERMTRRAQAALRPGDLGRPNNGEAVFRAYITSDLAKFQSDYEKFVRQLLDVKG